MRIALLLPGLHLVPRGAEAAFESIGEELARAGDDVTLFGCGQPKAGTSYDFVHVGSISRSKFERWPTFPPMRSEFRWEELTWIPDLLRRYRPSDFDVAVTCSYPFTNWLLRRGGSDRPASVFVTQNGDWPAFDDRAENRWFRCDGLVCTNHEYLERNRERWECLLVPNGIDTASFRPGDAEREKFGLPADAPVVLMVSALQPHKRVDVGIEAAAEIDEAVLVVAGDGEERQRLDALAEERMPGRFVRLQIDRSEMPGLYRSADVVFHPTYDESFGNVYVEALATGTPLVAHRSAHTEWVTGDDARLVDTDDKDANVQALRDAIPERLDASRIDAVHERFSWETIAVDYQRFFRSLLPD